MKLDVPFYKQTTLLNCGPTALRMALSFLDKDPGIKILEQKSELKEGKGLFTIQIAIAAASLGYKSKFFTTSASFNEENLKLDFYKKYAEDSKAVEGYLNKAKKLNVIIKERSISLKELLSYVNKDSLPIALLNWNVIINKEGYLGHFVPVIGFSKDSVILHNPGIKYSEAFIYVKNRVFEEARKSIGTDEDIVVVYN